MSLKSKNMRYNDVRGSYRGAADCSRDYASFTSLDGQNYAGREIWSKVEGVGDYETSHAFTGDIEGTGNRQRWTPLADRQNTRGDGPYSKEGCRSTERARKQSDGNAGGGQITGGKSPFDY